MKGGKRFSFSQYSAEAMARSCCKCRERKCEMADRKKGVLLSSPLLSRPSLSGGRGADYDGWMQPPSSSSSSVSALFMAPVAISWRAGKRGKAPLQEVFFYLSSNLPPRSLARSQEIGKSITRETPGDGPILPESRCCSVPASTVADLSVIVDEVVSAIIHSMRGFISQKFSVLVIPLLLFKEVRIFRP